LIDVEHLKGL